MASDRGNRDVADAELSLRWHVPRSAGTSLRFRLSQLACVSVVFAIVIWLITEPDQRWQGVGVVAVLAGLMAGYQIWQSSRQPPSPPNVWLDAAGFHWLSSDGREHVLARDEITHFWLGFDEDTHRALPSLTFLLRGGFLSQPIEMHPPVDARQMRDWFREQWNLMAVEHLPETPVREIALDQLCDEERQVWRFAGSLADLKSLAQSWREIARDQLPPPPGARPAEVRFKFNNHGGMLLCIGPHSWIEQGSLVIAKDQLASLADEMDHHLSADTAISQLEFDCDTGHRWRFELERK